MKKRITCLIIGIVILILIIGGIIGLLGYWGFIPSVAKIFGSDKPRDLGVKYENNNYELFLTKVGFVQKLEENVSVSKSYSKYGKFEEKTFELTSEEISSAIKNIAYPFNPFYDMQVKLGNDSKFETSGMIDTSKIFEAASYFNIAPDLVDEYVDKFNLNEKKYPFYASGSVSIINNQIDIQINKIEIGRFPIPNNIITSFQADIAEEISDFFTSVKDTDVKSTGQLSIKKLEIKDNKVIFEGRIPTEEIIYLSK